MADEPTSPSPSRDLQVGDYVGHYRLVELLAVGGMGMVFKAYEEALHRHVAVKILSPQLAADPALSQRFLAEARALANAARHPGGGGEQRGAGFRGAAFAVARLHLGDGRSPPADGEGPAER